MQFRAGILYIVLFSVISAGAYGVIATAESPTVTIDEGSADHVLSEGEPVTIGDRTYNVTELSGGSGTLEYVNESAILEAEWEDGDTVELENGTEYTVIVNEAEDGDENESDDGNETDEGNESDGQRTVTLREDFDEDEYEIVERDDGDYVVAEDEELVPIDEFDEIDSRTYEVGDTVAFNESEQEEVVEGEVVDIGSEAVTVEYVGTATEEYELEDGSTTLIGEEEFAVYFPSEDRAHLSSDLDSFEQQQAEVESFNERITGLWWVIAMSISAVAVLAALAFMPVRG